MSFGCLDDIEGRWGDEGGERGGGGERNWRGGGGFTGRCRIVCPWTFFFCFLMKFGRGGYFWWLQVESGGGGGGEKGGGEIW